MVKQKGKQAAFQLARSGSLVLAFWLLWPGSLLEGKDRYEKWLDEVHWIASKREVEEFKLLSSDEEKRTFIEEFWRRRDPTPGTLRNEYKEEYYRRWEFVNKNFREGIPGWRTDRGRIYLIHGPPDSEEFRALPTTGTPGSRRSRESIIWTYFEMPNNDYYKGRMVLVFQPNIGLTEQDFTLGESRMALGRAQQLYNRSGFRASEMIDMAVRYRLVAAGPPAMVSGRGEGAPASGVGEFARFVGDILRSPGELLERRRDEEERQQASRRELRQQIETRIHYEDLPFYLSTQDFYQGEYATVTVAWQFPLESLQFEEENGIYEAKIDVMAEVRDDQGRVVDEIFKTLRLIYNRKDLKESKDRDFRYLNEFHLEKPGDYLVTSIARDVYSGRLGSQSQPVHCKGLEDGKLTLSGLVLSRSVVEADLAQMARELVFENWQVIPESDGDFSRDDRLLVFFKLYNVDLSSPSALVVSYSFLSEDRLVRQVPARQLTQYTDPERRTIAHTSIVDLSDFQPGSYHLQVNAVDFNSKEYAIGRAQFVIR